MRRGVVITVVSVLLAIAGVYSFNYFQLQYQMNSVLKEDPRNTGIKVWVHFGNYLNTSTLIYDLRSIAGANSMADVFRVLLQFAERMQSREFDIVKLHFRGKAKFMMDGDCFQTLGKEYSWQNPIYTMNHFPENLMDPDGSRAYSEWTGG